MTMPSPGKFISEGELRRIEHAQIISRRPGEPGEEFDEYLEYDLRPTVQSPAEEPC
jgi:hypothetical protein